MVGRGRLLAHPAWAACIHDRVRRGRRYTWVAELPQAGAAPPRLVQDVQAWVASPAANHGWILIGKEVGAQNAKRFQSRDNAVAGTRPRLTVVYALPEPPADDGDVPLPLWALVLLALGLARQVMRRSAHG